MARHLNKYADNLHAVKMKYVPSVHTAVKSFDDLPTGVKKKLKEIKAGVCALLGNTDCFVFGSFAAGNWHEQSDYDVIIRHAPTNMERELIRRQQYGVKVDYRFGDFGGAKTIQIP